MKAQTNRCLSNQDDLHFKILSKFLTTEEQIIKGALADPAWLTAMYQT